MRLAIGVLLTLAGCDELFGLEPIASRDAMIDASPPGPWAQVAAGESHTCVVQLDGSLWCWGRNEVGQLGLGATIVEVDAPTRVGSAAWKTISSTRSTTCGIQLDDTLWCWGSNLNGHVGDGTAVDRYEPFQIGSSTWLTVSAGGDHACAIDAASHLWCWGTNANGQLGTGSVVIGVTQPTEILPTMTWSSITAGAQHTCAIAGDQTAWCWGSDSNGQLGIGSQFQTKSSPQLLSNQRWTALAAGLSHTCGLLEDGRLRCWGSNQFGQLGDTINNSLNPTPVGDDSADWVTLTAGTQHTCATRLDGSVWCWGSNANGQRGYSIFSSYGPVPAAVEGGSISWLAVAAGDRHTCAVGGDRQLWCFGLGAFLSEGRTVREPTQVAGSWRLPAAGRTSTCAIDVTDRLACWGANDSGQIGDGTRARRLSPIIVDPGPWTAIDLSSTVVCGLRTGGELWCWGYNSSGLGDGSISRLLPTKMSTRTWSAIALGGGHACAIEAMTSLLYCWGSGSSGRLGTGDSLPKATPTQVGMLAWTSVAAGANHTCGTNSTEVQCWGYGFYGQIGDGTTGSTANRDVPTSSIPAITGGTAVALGGSHTCALSGDQLSCWGQNIYGQLGDGTLASKASPVAINGQWNQITTGASFGCGIDNNRGLWCWGDNGRGQLGNGTLANSSSPKQVGTDLTWRHVSAGTAYTCAVKLDDSLWCWGNNDDGQLGLGLADYTGELVLVAVP